MKDVNVTIELLKKDLSSYKLNDYESVAMDAYNRLKFKNGLGGEFTGWVNFPIKIEESEIISIKETADRLRKLGSCLVVIGIGGSYLGAKAVIDLLDDYYTNNNKIIFLGNNVSPTYIASTLKYLENVDFTVNVISKSGKTLEPAIAFRLVRELLIKKYGDEYHNRVVVTTSSENSILHDEALKNNYQEFFIPSSIGGRYSVLTAVGLLPISYAGYDIFEIIRGSIYSYQECISTPFCDNDAIHYALYRYLLYKKGKTIEIFSTYEPKMKNLGEWWKQLYGESEGKNHKGIFPVSVLYSTDLHSLGQYVQDGLRNIFETVISVDEDLHNIVINKDEENNDKLNYLAGKDMTYIRKQIEKGVIKAHIEGDVPNIIINIKKINEYSIGYLLYFFMFACGVSGYLLDVNPFNQEGVEAYKKNVMALLKK